MLDSSASFCAELNAGLRPRWLSFIGDSGTGKTFISEAICNYAKTIPTLMFHHTLKCGVIKEFWPKLLSKLRDGEYWRVNDLREANFLFLDEIVIEHDPSGFAKDKLYEVLSSRCGKWTVLTTNMRHESISHMDQRIMSRMTRDGSAVIACNTMDYSLRRAA